MINNKTLLTYFDKGSYGYIFSDLFNNVYKITSIVYYEKFENNVDCIIDRNNLIEIIMLNFFNTNNKIYNDITNQEFINNNQNKNIFNITSDLETDYNNKEVSRASKMRCIPKSEKYYNLIQTNKTLYFKFNEINNFFTFNKKLDKINNNDFVIFNKFTKMKKIKFSTSFNIKNIINKFKLYSEQLLIAIYTLHNNGFLHGDISPNNIMIDCDISNSYNLSLTEYMLPEKLVLIDLGAVKSIDSNYYYNTCTLTSRCPEDLEASNNNNNNDFIFKSSGVKSDIWSIGIFLSQIILGDCVILNLYNELHQKKIEENIIENEILKYYNSITNIEIEKNILLKIKNKNIDIDIDNEDYKELIRLCRIVEKMLVINPDNRTESVEKVYEEIFNKKFEYNFKKEYTYEYPFLKNDKFLTFRNNLYNSIILTCLKIHNMLVIPFLIDLLDRFFNELLKNNIDIYGFDFGILESIILASICLSSIFITFDNISINLLLKNSNFKNTNIFEIQKYIINIIITLNYDIYRPFDIFGNSIDAKIIYNNNNNNNNNEFSQVSQASEMQSIPIINNDYKCNSYYRLSKLDKIYTEIIMNNIVEVTPQYYIDKLLINTL